VWTARDR
jgi:uncharacterized protein YuzB (UPF0349 family)